VWSTFRDRPLPGDLVVRRRHDLDAVQDVYVVTNWPDGATVTAGPFDSYSAALDQARAMATDEYAYIWFDYARDGEPERLDRVAAGER
jgi:hypothetical protein